MNGKKIVAEARKWLGVKFCWHGRVRCGVDCLGLVICVGDVIGHKYENRAVSQYDVPYSSNSDFDKIKEYFSVFYIKKSKENLVVGDIILQRIGGAQYHLGIYAGGTIIHASLINRKVVENRFDVNGEFDVFGFLQYRL